MRSFRFLYRHDVVELLLYRMGGGLVVGSLYLAPPLETPRVVTAHVGSFILEKDGGDAQR